jgi:tubulin-specific chaperone B
MIDDSKKLGFYSPRHGMRVHVVDHDPMSLSRGGGLDDVSQVEKYVMSEEDYDKRSNTLRSWKREQLKKNPHFKFSDMLPGAKSAEPAVDWDDDALLEGFAVGMRCSVTPGDRRGEVAFVGRVDDKKGVWIGVRYDEPVGKGDGSSGGKRYFEAESKFGSFLRPTFVKVGEFPPLELDDELGPPAEGADEEVSAAATETKSPEEAKPAPRRTVIDDADDNDDEL